MRSIKLTLKSLVVVAALFAVSATMTSCEKESNNKQILGFGFTTPAAVGVIDETGKTVKVAVPEGTDITALSPIISVSENATVSPASGVVTNFTNPVQYTVTAEDGSTAAYTVTVTVGAGGEPVELTSPITTNTTLKDLGLPIDYVYKGHGLLEVKNNAVLTIEPGVCIQFTNKGGGIEVNDGAAIKAIGTAEKRIQFIGTGTNKGCWDKITVYTISDNQFEYVDFINGGSNTDRGVLHLDGAKVGISHCTFIGGFNYGIQFAISSGGGMRETNLTAFDNNTISNMDNAPIYADRQLTIFSKFDLTSVFTGNTKQYIEVYPPHTLNTDATINEASVPYYFNSNIHDINTHLTIKAGVTIYVAQSGYLFAYGTAGHTGYITISGTAEKPVTFTRLPGTTYHWGGINIGLLPGSVIEHCIIDYAGGQMSGKNNVAALNLNNFGTPGLNLTLRNLTIRNSLQYAIELDANHKNGITYSNVTFENCASGVHIYYGDISYNSLDDVP